MEDRLLLRIHRQTFPSYRDRGTAIDLSFPVGMEGAATAADSVLAPSLTNYEARFMATLFMSAWSHRIVSRDQDVLRRLAAGLTPAPLQNLRPTVPPLTSLVDPLEYFDSDTAPAVAEINSRIDAAEEAQARRANSAVTSDVDIELIQNETSVPVLRSKKRRSIENLLSNHLLLRLK